MGKMVKGSKPLIKGMIKGSKGGKKGRSSKRVNTSLLRISKNIYMMPSGNYRAIKMIDGVSYKDTFSNKKVAQAWVNSL